MMSLLRKVVKLAIFLLIVNAGYQFIPPYLHYVQFKDAVKETVLFSRDLSEDALADKIMDSARENSVPIEREKLEVRRNTTGVYVDASYVQPMALLPTYTYRWPFEVKAASDNLTSRRRGGF